MMLKISAPIPDKCNNVNCSKRPTHTVKYDFIYDQDRQRVICCVISYLCGRHTRKLQRCLLRAHKEFLIIEFKEGREEVQFT